MSLAQKIQFNNELLDAEIAMAVDVMRAALERLPVHKREAVKAQLADLLEKPKTPQRGGDVLNKVVQLFQRAANDRKEWRAAEIVTAVNAEPKQVYNALQYLRSRRVIQKKGYGLYVLEDGTVIEGSP